MDLPAKLTLLEQRVGKRIVDAVVVGPEAETADLSDRIVVQEALEASDVPHHHDRHLLRIALEHAVQRLG